MRPVKQYLQIDELGPSVQVPTQWAKGVEDGIDQPDVKVELKTLANGHGNIAVDSIGDKTIAIPAGRQVIERGSYFLALVSDGAHTLDTFGAGAFAAPLDGQSNTVAGELDQVVLVKPGESGAASNGLDGIPPNPRGTRSGQFAALRVRAI